MFNILHKFFNPSVTVEVEETPDKKAPSIILIHGANATGKCFNYIKANLPAAEYHTIEYSVLDSFHYNLERMITEIDTDKTYYIIAHSMGGIYAVHLTQHINIEKAITISTPFAGANIADWARYMMPRYQLFKDVSSRAIPIRQLREIHVTVPWKQIVTTRGDVPWLNSPNDGVVTVSSMSIREDMENIKFNESHNEVLLSEELINLIRQDFFN